MNSPKPSSQEDTNQKFDKACTQAAHLFQDRNREYDNAFKKYGLLGVIFEILGIVNRLPPMTIWKRNDGLIHTQKLRDLFLDLHNYSNMALILLEENNWNGKDPIYTEDEHK